MLILFKIDNGQDQNSVFASVLHQLKGVPADYHLKHLWHQLTKSLIVMRELLKVSLFFLYIFIFLPQTLFHKNFHSVHSVLKNIISQKLSQCALCTYKHYFTKLSQCALCTYRHYFTKTFTVCALYLQKLFHKNFYSVCSVLTKIISQKHYIK